MPVHVRTVVEYLLHKGKQQQKAGRLACLVCVRVQHKHPSAHIRLVFSLLICICFQLEHFMQMWLRTLELIKPKQFYSLHANT